VQSTAVPAPCHSDVSVFCRSDVPVFCRSDVPVFYRSDVPVFYHSVFCRSGVSAHLPRHRIAHGVITIESIGVGILRAAC
jgi:hypothetical protein